MFHASAPKPPKRPSGRKSLLTLTISITTLMEVDEVRGTIGMVMATANHWDRLFLPDSFEAKALEMQIGYVVTLAAALVSEIMFWRKLK